MSITTEITRLQKAKSDIKTAIENKGVAVGDGLIDTYAGKIAEISAEGGGDSYYDTFWDATQDYGKRTDYHYAFAGIGWTDEIFYPKYDIKPYQFIYTFSRTRMKIDLAKRLEDCGVKLDFSNIGTSPTYGLYDTWFTHLPDLDLSRCTTINYITANNQYLETIDSITFSENLIEASNIFRNCNSLKNITVKGVIPISMNFSYSPLTVYSMISIIEHLKNYKGTDKQDTYTLSFSSACWAELEESAPPPNAEYSWKKYVMSLGWLV